MYNFTSVYVYIMCNKNALTTIGNICKNHSSQPRLGLLLLLAHVYKMN